MTHSNRAVELAQTYLPREARVGDLEGHPTTGPWPWCPKAELRDPAFPGQDINDWPITREAVPHDAHIENGGNTWCRGVPGIIPAEPEADLVAEIAARLANVDRLRDRLARAEAHLATAEEALTIVQEAKHG